MRAVPSATVNVASTRPASVMRAKSPSVNASPSGRAGSPCPPPGRVAPVATASTSSAPNVSGVPSYGFSFVGAVSVTARGVIFTVPKRVVTA